MKHKISTIEWLFLSAACRNTTVFLLVFATMVPLSFSQTRRIQVTDAQSGTPVAHANITDAGTGSTLTTDEAGICRIIASTGETLSVSHVSYSDTTFTVLSEATHYIISLRARELSAVDI